MGWWEGGAAIWTKSKRTAAFFFVSPSLRPTTKLLALGVKRVLKGEQGYRSQHPGASLTPSNPNVSLRSFEDMILVTSDNSAYFYCLRVQFVGFMNIFTSLLSKSTKRQNGMYYKFLVSCFKRYLGKIRKCMNVSAGCFGQFPKLLKNLPVLHPVCSIISLTSDEAAFFH